MSATEILKIAQRMQAIAQAGLHFNNNAFDRERYEEIRELSAVLANQVSNAPIEKIRELFSSDRGFQTPKIDIRSVIIQNRKILLIKEKADGKWALPGGFADVNISPSENAAKEVFEEAGLKVKIKRLLAIIDCNKHDFPPMEFHYYKMVFLCESASGTFIKNTETDEAAYFDFSTLPPLSLMRNNSWLFELIENLIENDAVFFD